MQLEILEVPLAIPYNAWPWKIAPLMDDDPVFSSKKNDVPDRWSECDWPLLQQLYGARDASIQHPYQMEIKESIYPPVIKRGNGQSPEHGGFSGKNHLSMGNVELPRVITGWCPKMNG